MAVNRVPFNGRAWPRDSPVARVYDVSNTSTSMVLLNMRRKKRSQLRGLTERSAEIATPNPERHIPDEPSVNWYHHKKCLTSSSETFKPKLNLDLRWVNATQRPPVLFDSGSHVNHKRHTSCRVTPDTRPAVGWRGAPRRPQTGASTSLGSELRSMTPMLNDPDLTPGERKYLYSIARIYSTSQMKALKVDQYHQLLFKELGKGYHSPQEYERYLNYLNTPRKMQYRKLDNYDDISRSRSAPPPTNSDACGRGGESERSASRQNKRVPPLSSRSWAPSMISSTSRMSSVSSRQKAGGKKQPVKRRPAEKATKADKEKPVRSKSPEPVSATVTVDDEDDDDGTTHTRKKESEKPEEPLNSIQKSEEASPRSKAKTSSQPATPRDAEESPLTPRQANEGVTPRKDDDGPSPRRDDVLSPRKGEEEEGESPRKSDTVDGAASEGKESSQDTAAANNNVAASSSNTTSNNFLALIVSDAEKDDDTKTPEDSEQDKKSMEGAAQPESSIPRDFSDTKLASGYSPRVHKEGRNRPLSRAGRPSEIRERGNRENSDDDYDDTDEETEKVATDDKNDTIQEEPVQRSGLGPEQPVMDTSRSEDSKAEERGGEMDEHATTIHIDKRAGSPEEGSDDRAEETHDREGERSLIIPVTPRGDNQSQNVAALDISAEGKNRDVEKIEY
ncbi:hypothetical protein V1264_021243 [Littorina saxatilis]|uniref:Uncharacterized protein n=1 Tax=Littorina saxatilis TaxID=31220 RepID=A0AAN9AHY6_9CAEN